MVLVSFHGFPAENNIETMMKMAPEYKTSAHASE